MTVVYERVVDGSHCEIVEVDGGFITRVNGLVFNAEPMNTELNAVYTAYKNTKRLDILHFGVQYCREVVNPIDEEVM